ncbi:MAG: mechanosensitive ion channel family protein [Rhizobiaceae bacterium]
MGIFRFDKGLGLALALVFSLLATALLTPAPAAAQSVLDVFDSGSSTDASDLDTLIGKAREGGSTIVIINPPGGDEEKVEEKHMPMTSAALLQARENLRRMVINSRNFFKEFDETLKAASPDGSLMWIVTAVVTAVGGMMIGLGIYKLITGFLQEHFQAFRDRPNPSRSQKLSYLLLRSSLLLVSTAIMFGVTILVAVIFDTGHEPTRMTIYTLVLSYATYRILRYVIFLNVFVPDAPNIRMINLGDERARKTYRDWYVVIAISVVLFGFCQWLFGLGVSRDIHSFAFIVASGLGALMVGFISAVHRHDWVQVIRGREATGEKARILELLGRAMLPAILIYLAVAWAVTTYRLALDLPDGYVLVAAPIIIFVAAIFAYGLSIFLLDLIYERRERRFKRERLLRNLQTSREAREREAANKPPMEELDDSADLMDEGEEMIVYQAEERPEVDREYRPVFKDFFERSIAATILVVCVGELARIWGVDVGRQGGHPLAVALDILLVGLITAFAIRSFNKYIDNKIIEEGGTLDNVPVSPGDGDSEGGVGQSRLATLLPIVRNVVVGALVIVVGMIVLSAIGVNVAPLFAGAGVVGLAIGFGAQTLIRDMFSGVFFLIDDAFRKGEYIEVGNVRGVIEKISVRSFQLRHHLGAVHTVPFGEIHQLTNFSRDWVMMKLPLRLTYDTDVEHVRKLVKKLGQRLLEHPVIGHMFIQPLKSQGVYAMEDSAMIIRVKFMTKPGDQFVARKVIYAEIRELFEREGIKFAHREVTVRLADGKKAEDLSDDEREAIAGSVRSAIEEENAKKPATAGMDR